MATSHTEGANASSSSSTRAGTAPSSGKRKNKELEEGEAPSTKQSKRKSSASEHAEERNDVSADARVDATEHDAVGSSQELTLDDVISLFKESLDDRPKVIFAAALSLRDTTGRDRKQVLR